MVLIIVSDFTATGWSKIENGPILLRPRRGRKNLINQDAAGCSDGASVTYKSWLIWQDWSSEPSLPSFKAGFRRSVLLYKQLSSLRIIKCYSGQLPIKSIKVQYQRPSVGHWFHIMGNDYKHRVVWIHTRRPQSMVRSIRATRDCLAQNVEEIWLTDLTSSLYPPTFGTSLSSVYNNKRDVRKQNFSVKLLPYPHSCRRKLCPHMISIVIKDSSLEW